MSRLGSPNWFAGAHPESLACGWKMPLHPEQCYWEKPSSAGNVEDGDGRRRIAELAREKHFALQRQKHRTQRSPRFALRAESLMREHRSVFPMVKTGPGIAVFRKPRGDTTREEEYSD